MYDHHLAIINSETNTVDLSTDGCDLSRYRLDCVIIDITHPFVIGTIDVEVNEVVFRQTPEIDSTCCLTFHTPPVGCTQNCTCYARATACLKHPVSTRWVREHKKSIATMLIANTATITHTRRPVPSLPAIETIPRRRRVPTAPPRLTINGTPVVVENANGREESVENGCDILDGFDSIAATNGSSICAIDEGWDVIEFSS